METLSVGYTKKKQSEQFQPAEDDASYHHFISESKLVNLPTTGLSSSLEFLDTHSDYFL